MHFLDSLLPLTGQFGAWGYLLVFVIAFGESLAFVGTFMPGAALTMLAGFLAAQGYFDIGHLIWITTLGAILGDSASYWLGTKGTRFFRNENRFLKLAHLERGQAFFKRYGDKSVFLGRFISPVRPIIPFVAGLVKMRSYTFMLWNGLSALLWSTLYLLLGYFFGGTIKVIGMWSMRAGLFLILGIVIFFIIKSYIKKEVLPKNFTDNNI